MKKIILSLSLVLIASSAIYSQNWEFQELLIDMELPQSNSWGFHDVAVDPNGNIWLPLHGNLAQDTIYTPDGDTINTRPIYALDPNGNHLPFSPIRWLDFPDGSRDTLHANNPINGSGKGLSVDRDGNILYTSWSTVYRVNYQTGEGLNRYTPADMSSMTNAVQDDNGLIYVSYVIAGARPVIILDDDFNYIGNAIDTLGYINRTLAVSPDGKELYTGSTWNGFGIVHYHSEIPGVLQYTVVDTFGNWGAEKLWASSLDWGPEGLLWAGNLRPDWSGPKGGMYYAYDVVTKERVDSVGIAMGDSSAGGTYSPRGAAWSADGFTMYLADYDYNTVGIWTRVGVEGPHISVTPLNLDFGVLEAGQSSTHQLMLRSIGTDTVSVTNITNSMPDYSVNPTSLVIPPGETEQVDVTFSPLSIGVIEDSLTIESNDPDDPVVTVFLSGEGEAGDLTVSIYSTFGEPGDTVIVPVMVTETGAYTINSAEFELVSDSTIVAPLDASFDGAIPEGTDWILQYNAQPDTFNVAMGGADTLSGFGDLVVLRYIIDAAAIEGQSSDLSFHSFLFNEGIPMAAVLGGRIDVGIPYGDVSRDGGVHAYDGALIMMYLAGYVSFDHNQEIVAEVSGDGSITSFDASLILQYVVGLIDEFPAAGGAMPPFSPAASFDIPDLSAAPGEIIIFPVIMADVHDVVSLEARLEYDPSILTLEEFIVSDDFDGWLKSELMGDGSISLYLAHGTPMGGDLLLGEARFLVSDEASEGCEISLTDVRLNEEPVVENAAYAQFSLTITGVLGESDGIPTEYGLSQNYPNPFNPVTEIRYALPEDAKVKLSIYNLLGQEVARLVYGDMPAGYHRVKWHAERVASGVYVYRIKANGFIEVKKLVLLR